jgi:hypothetical protein
MDELLALKIDHGFEMLNAKLDARTERLSAQLLAGREVLSAELAELGAKVDALQRNLDEIRRRP